MELSRRISPLQELVLKHLAATGDSVADVSRRGGLARQTIQAIVSRESKGMPRRRTLEKLARGLELPYETVLHAAIASVEASGANNGSLPVLTDDPLTVLLTRTIGELDESQRQILLATARAMKKQTTEREEAH